MHVGSPRPLGLLFMALVVPLTGCVGYDALYALGSGYMLCELWEPEMEFSAVGIVETRTDHGRAYGASYAFLPSRQRPSFQWEHAVMRSDETDTDVSRVDVTFVWPRRDAKQGVAMRWSREIGFMMQADSNGGGAVGAVAGVALHIASGRHACILGSKARLWDGNEGAEDGSAISIRLGYAGRF